MPINIFANAEKPSAPSSTDIVGRFRAGRQLQGRPMSLTTWRITTGDPEVAAAVAERFGAVEGPQEWETKTDERLEVITEATSVSVIIANPRHVTSEMVLWGRKGKLRQCDGVKQANGESCVCPSDYGERIKGAQEGTACEPSISYLFSLADAPELGRFRFQTGSWTVARQVAEVEAALADIDGPATGTLTLEQRTRKDAGTTYTIALLKITGPADTEESF
jgi:hypothetical protein